VQIMSAPFLALAMSSPGRQLSFRRTVVFHLLILSALGWIALHVAPDLLPYVGDAILVVGIVEGAAMIGWRLAQLPKSQALEFLLVSPLRPKRVFFYEAVGGFGRFALVTLSGLPIYLILIHFGRLQFADIAPLLLIPMLWGGLAGLGLTAWAYESLAVRRWGERIVLVLILIYLVIGVLAAERLQDWLLTLPAALAEFFFRTIGIAFHYNPFGAMEYWLSQRCNREIALERMTIVAAATGMITVGLLARAAARLRAHFHDLHYTPIEAKHRSSESGIGDHPLAWWAVRRVLVYSGRTNIWLAGGFGIVYAAYTVLGDAWPSWMGTLVFQIFERMGGVPAVAAGLTVLAAVPASFQYGLWDASRQDRCKRLELLLLTRLEGTDYWRAAAAAAWRRGRGYFFVALILWTALGLSGRATISQVLAATAAGTLLWAFSFALGFRAFSRGVHSNGLGMLLTLGLPLVAVVLIRANVPILSSLLPVAAVYSASTAPPDFLWLVGPLLTGCITLFVARRARRDCDRDLRAWFDRNQGIKLLD